MPDREQVPGRDHGRPPWRGKSGRYILQRCVSATANEDRRGQGRKAIAGERERLSRPAVGADQGHHAGAASACAQRHSAESVARGSLRVFGRFARREMRESEPRAAQSPLYPQRLVPDQPVAGKIPHRLAAGGPGPKRRPETDAVPARRTFCADFWIAPGEAQIFEKTATFIEYK